MAIVSHLTPLLQHRNVSILPPYVALERSASSVPTVRASTSDHGAHTMPSQA